MCVKYMPSCVDKPKKQLWFWKPKLLFAVWKAGNTKDQGRVWYCQSFLCFLPLWLPDRKKEWIKSIWITFALSRAVWMGREGNYSFPRTCKLGSNNYKKSFKSTIWRSSKWPEYEMTSHRSAHLRDLLPASLSDLEKREQFSCRYYHLQEQMPSADTCCQSFHACYSSAAWIPSLSCYTKAVSGLTLLILMVEDEHSQLSGCYLLPSV